MKALIFSVFVTAFIFIILYGSLQILGETVQTLLTFNLLFLLIFTPLKGSLERKAAIILLGNILSFVWSSLFYSFIHLAVGHADGVLNSLYVILGPLMNVLWVVAFWSVSLTFLAKTERKRWES